MRPGTSPFLLRCPRSPVTPEERFRALFESAYRPLLAYARRRTNASDADDLVAEVLTTAWRRLDDVPADHALPWLYGVARRVLANQRRATDRRRALVTRLASQPAPVAAESEDPAVLSALERLRPADQEVLRLAAWEHLDTAEIAVALGCSPNAAALRLSRARRRFRETLTGTDQSRTQRERRRSAGA